MLRLDCFARCIRNSRTVWSSRSWEQLRQNYSLWDTAPISSICNTRWVGIFDRLGAGVVLARSTGNRPGW